MTEIETSLWDAPAEEVMASREVRVASLAQAAVEPLWPFLSAATTRAEFDHRMGLVEEGLTQRVAAVVGEAGDEQDKGFTAARGHLMERWAQRESDIVANRLRAATATHARCKICGESIDYTEGEGWFHSQVGPDRGHKAEPESGSKSGSKIAGDGMTAEVMAFPKCDICQAKDAAYDGKTVMGPWAYMCESCFEEAGVGLGLGQGQKLVLAPSSKEGAVGFSPGDKVEVWGQDETEGAVVDRVTDQGVVVRYTDSGNTETVDPGRVTKASAKSNVCPKCGSSINPVIHGNVMTANCDACGWSGTKKKASADLYPADEKCKVCQHTWGVHDGLKGCKVCATADDGTGNMPSPSHQFQPANPENEHKVPEGFERFMQSSLHTAESKAKPGEIQHLDNGAYQRSKCQNCGGTIRRKNQMSSGWSHASTNTKYCPTKSATLHTAGTEAAPKDGTVVENEQGMRDGRNSRKAKCVNCGETIYQKGTPGAGGLGGWVHQSGNPWCLEDWQKSSSLHTAAGAIRWTSDTHMGVGYIVGLSTSGDVYEVYSNPNSDPTPCSWAQYGPEGDTGPNSQIAVGRGFATMQEAMKDAEAHAAGVTASLHTAAYPWTPEGGNDSDPNYFMENSFGGRGGTRTVDGVTVHTFETTVKAYNESQVSDDIKDGDILAVPSEGVVGILVQAWPMAVVVGPGGPGEFHMLKPGMDISEVEGGKYVHAAQVAQSLSKTGTRHTAPGGGTHAPYSIEQRGDKWVVVNDLGEVKGTHDSKEEARDQQKALYANVPGASEQAEKKSAVQALLESEAANYQPVTNAGPAVTALLLSEASSFHEEVEAEAERRKRHEQYWAEHPEEYERHLRQNAAKQAYMDTATCPHCKGSGQEPGEQYVGCTQCGGTGEVPYDEAHTSSRREAVNEGAYGTERYQNLPAPAKPSWITEWADEEMRATKEMTEQGLNAYVPPNPFPNLTTLQRVRNTAMKLAEVGDIGEEDEQGDLNAATGDTGDSGSQQAYTTKPAQVPGQNEQPHMVTIEQEIVQPPGLDVAQGPSDPQMGSGGGFDMGYAHQQQDPMSPTPEQMVAAKAARLAERIRLDNPSMDPTEARRLAFMTIAKHPEMVKGQR